MAPPTLLGWNRSDGTALLKESQRHVRRDLLPTLNADTRNQVGLGRSDVPLSVRAVRSLTVSCCVCALPPCSVGQGPEAKQKSLVDLLHKTQTEGKQLSRSGSEYGSLADKDSEAAGGGGGGAAAAGSTGGPGSVAGDGLEDHAAADGAAAAAEHRTSEGGGAAGQEPGSGGADGGREQGAGAAPGRPRVLLPAMLTVSSQQACKYMRHYGQIMRWEERRFAGVTFHAVGKSRVVRTSKGAPLERLTLCHSAARTHRNLPGATALDVHPVTPGPCTGSS